MAIPSSAGRAVGLLLLVQLVTGLILPYVLLLPVSQPAGAFLETAAQMALTVRMSVLMLLIGAAASLATAIFVWPIVRDCQPRLGLWLLALAVMNLTLQLIENAHWLTLLTTSQAFATASQAETEGFKALAFSAQAAFRWAHYSHILVVVTWLLTLYLLFYRAFLIPRFLSVAGIFATVLHFVGIILPAFGGYSMANSSLYGAPLAVAITAAAVWLMINGTRDNMSQKTERTPG